MTSWFTYQGGVPSKKGTYDDSVSGYTGVSTWFFQKGNTFPLKPQDSPSPLGPTVTCRDGTCVHLPGYCQDCEPPRTGSALPYTWSQGARSNCQAYDSEGENPGNGHFHYWMLTRTCFTFASSGQTWRCYCRLRCEKNQLRPILLRPTHSTSHRLQAGY